MHIQFKYRGGNIVLLCGGESVSKLYSIQGWQYSYIVWRKVCQLSIFKTMHIQFKYRGGNIVLLCGGESVSKVYSIQGWQYSYILRRRDCQQSIFKTMHIQFKYRVGNIVLKCGGESASKVYSKLCISISSSNTGLAIQFYSVAESLLAKYIQNQASAYLVQIQGWQYSSIVWWRVCQQSIFKTMHQHIQFKYRVGNKCCRDFRDDCTGKNLG